MLQKIREFLGPRESVDDEPDYPVSDQERSALESGETNRLNSNHWAPVTDQPINDTIAMRGETIRARTNHEAWNNTTIEGLIHQHTIAVAGDNGPLLDIESESEADDRWCREAIHVCEEWATHSDAAGMVNFATRLKNFWNRGGWTNGEWLDQIVYDLDATTPVKMRLHAVEVQRMVTPNSHYRDKSVVLGVKRNKFRAPTDYYVADQLNYGRSGDWYPSDYMIHGFEVMETGQARGVPWSQSGLPIAADLRDYDDQVMDAARAAADMALVAFTKHEDAKYRAPKKSERRVRFKRRMLHHLLPGWDVKALQSNQPTAQYKEHRHERKGDLGLGRGVPSMITRLDARDHNYSSARFDRSMLHESAKHVRATLYNDRIYRIYRLVIAEAVLAGVLRPPPQHYQMSLVWPAMPQIDEWKSAKAEDQYLTNGTLPYSTAVAENHGMRMVDVVRRRSRDERMLSDAGLPSVANRERPALIESNETDKEDDE